MLQASAHAWGAIHAHRGAAPSQISQATFHANEACSALASIITTASRKSFGSARKSSSLAIRRVSSPKVFKKLPSPKAPRKAPPKRTVPRKPMKVLPKIGRTASSGQPNGVPQTPKARNTEGTIPHQSFSTCVDFDQLQRRRLRWRLRRPHPQSNEPRRSYSD